MQIDTANESSSFMLHKAFPSVFFLTVLHNYGVRLWKQSYFVTTVTIWGRFECVCLKLWVFKWKHSKETTWKLLQIIACLHCACLISLAHTESARYLPCLWMWHFGEDDYCLYLLSNFQVSELLRCNVLCCFASVNILIIDAYENMVHFSYNMPIKKNFVEVPNSWRLWELISTMVS